MATHTNSKVNKFGSQRHNVRRKVVSMRNKGASWVEIAEAIESAPRTARRIFDEAKGQGQHYFAEVGRGGPKVSAAKVAELKEAGHLVD